MNFKKSIIVLFCFGTIASSCETNEPDVNSTEVKPEKIVFDTSFTEDLFAKILKVSEGSVSFSQQQLIDFLKIADPAHLKNGNSYHTELLFESFDCNCMDEMTISYDKKQEAFILYIYEEAFVGDMDWCPESSYQYSFGIKDQKAIDVKLEFLAG